MRKLRAAWHLLKALQNSTLVLLQNCVPAILSTNISKNSNCTLNNQGDSTWIFIVEKIQGSLMVIFVKLFKADVNSVYWREK